MFDVELVLRFFAFRQDSQNLRGALRDYFDYYVRTANRFAPELMQELGDLFSQSIALTYDVLGEQAFWLWRNRNGKWNWLSRPTTVAYDTIMAVMGENLHREAEIRACGDAIHRSLPMFYEVNYEAFAGRYTNPANITERRLLFQTHLSSVLAENL